MWETNTGYADPDSFVDQVYLSPNVHWQDEGLKAQYTALWEQERGELDRAKRGELLRQMVDIQLQDLNTSWAIRPGHTARLLDPAPGLRALEHHHAPLELLARVAQAIEAIRTGRGAVAQRGRPAHVIPSVAEESRVPFPLAGGKG